MHFLAPFAQSIGSFILVISSIVFIHEFGHYFVARLCGVRIETFSIGFGRELFGRTDKHGTRWKVSLIPMGGYVKMFGDAGAASAPDATLVNSMTDTDKSAAFYYQPRWKKAAIVAAGPAANFILTIAVFFALMMGNGILSSEPVIGDILPKSAAAKAGLKAGDRVVEVDGQAIESFNDIPMAIMTNLGTPIRVEIVRNGTPLALLVTPRMETMTDKYGQSQKQARIGIQSQIQTVKDVGVWGALVYSVERTYSLCTMTLKAMGQMVRGERHANELKGPVAIAQMSGQAAGDSWQVALYFIALLSANLGLVNLLPIPMLDGGHLMIYSIETLIRRDLPVKMVEYSFRVGTAILGMLMVYTLYNDLVQSVAPSL
jgi:regulator of sigma E protease